MSLSSMDFLKVQFAKLKITQVNLTGKTIVVSGSNVGKIVRLYYADMLYFGEHPILISFITLEICRDRLWNCLSPRCNGPFAGHSRLQKYEQSGGCHSQNQGEHQY